MSKVVFYEVALQAAGPDLESRRENKFPCPFLAQSRGVPGRNRCQSTMMTTTTTTGGWEMENRLNTKATEAAASVVIFDISACSELLHCCLHIMHFFVLLLFPAIDSWEIGGQQISAQSSS